MGSGQYHEQNFNVRGSTRTMEKLIDGCGLGE